MAAAPRISSRRRFRAAAGAGAGSVREGDMEFLQGARGGPGSTGRWNAAYVTSAAGGRLLRLFRPRLFYWRRTAAGASGPGLP
ncbi:hypothetical protein GCM10011577_33540 [Pseudarthrobacter polychromogenes]|uniref:Uncharacterized protein n=1 Tax=Pseudarthrobacter polychromogenes TaxID=1676 RepID=A0ABQ1XY50_9MICC|nr:hypothetical protein GCM10011577_33540 [Pseudarthrobacter polychromogenes]